MPKDNKLGLGLDDFKYGILLGAIAVILYSILSILDIWYEAEWIDYTQTGIYFLIIFASITIIIDYYKVTRK